MFRNDAKGRFDKLSLKKNKKKLESKRKLDHPIPTIILDESFDNLISCISNRRGDWKHISSSPIVIDDSFENCSPFKMPDPVRFSENVTPETCRRTDLSITPENRRIPVDLSTKTRPSIEGWSPAQDIICVSPKFTTPSQAKDIANESLEECSIKKIQEEHTNILDELYGDAWKSIPTLFKKKSVKSFENLDGVTKKLDFFDDNDKENACDIFDSNIRKFYEDNGFSTPRTNLINTDTKKKKKLYTAKEFDTPEIRRIKKELLIFTEKKDTKTKKKPYTSKEFDTPEIKKIKKDIQIFTEPKPKTKPIEKKQNSERKAKKVLEPEKPIDVKKFSFMGSLADNIPSWRCDPEALDFKNHYKTKRDQLTRRLFKDFNRLVFNNELEGDMPVVWDTKLRTTAGLATNRQIKSAGLLKIRTSSIKLSSKVIDGPQRLRDTLIHEMCHCATWIIDHELRAGHGPLWKKWAKHALKVIPELEEISRCHNLEIHFKYSYKCTQCGYTINRHSKSIDLTKKCCGYCRGKFELVLNKKNKDGVVVSTPAKTGEANEFALFVKMNYANFKEDGKTHAQVMKVLAERYSEKKKS